MATGLFLTAIFLLGLYKTFKIHTYHKTLLNFANEFHGRFTQFTNNYTEGRASNDNYIWLSKKSGQMQADLAGNGYIEFLDRNIGIHVPQYQLIVNSIPKFRDQSINSWEIAACENCLLRHIGTYERQLANINKDFKNPITWFRRGMTFILQIPVKLLQWFGLINNKATSSIIESRPFKLFSALTTIVTFTVGITTLIIRKDLLLDLFKTLLDYINN